MEVKVPVLIYEKQFYDNNCFWIIAYIADICNYNCEYCYNSKPRTCKLLDLDKLYDLMLFVKTTTNKNIILELIGGEPTLHPELINFCKKIRHICFKIEVLTNFSADDSIYKTLLENNVLLFASWHYANTEFISKAKRLGNNNITYCIMFENTNWKLSYEIFDKMINMFPNDVESSLISETDLPYNYTLQLLDEYKKLSAKIQKYKNRYSVKFSNNVFENKSFNDMYMNDDFCFKNWKCDAMTRHMYIHSNGNIYPCQSYYDYNDLALTNIYVDNYQKLLKFKPSICKFNTCSCTYSVKKERLYI